MINAPLVALQFNEGGGGTTANAGTLGGSATVLGNWATSAPASGQSGAYLRNDGAAALATFNIAPDTYATDGIYTRAALVAFEYPGGTYNANIDRQVVGMRVEFNANFNLSATAVDTFPSSGSETALAVRVPWTLMAMVGTGTGMRIYRVDANGVTLEYNRDPGSPGNPVFSGATPTPLIIGGNSTTNAAANLRGRLDNYMVHDAGLTTTQLQELYWAAVRGHDLGKEVQVNLSAATSMAVVSAQGGTLDAFNTDTSMLGSAGADLLIGGAGNDTLDGAGGNDMASYAFATAGVTVSLAISGAQITGGAGTDTLVNMEGLTGSDFDDALTGDAGANTLVGGAGHDTLTGGAGNDTLLGGAGNDSLDGGAGNDLIAGGAGADSMVGGAGADTLSYAGETAGVFMDFSGGGAPGGAALGDTATGFEAGLGGSGNDTLGTGLGVVSLHGGAGDDYILSIGTVDALLDGGEGADTLLAAAALGQTLLGAAGNDNVIGSSFDDVLEGGADADYLFGFTGHDLQRGGAGADTLDGNAVADTLEGGAGDDRLEGGVDSDTDLALFSGNRGDYGVTTVSGGVVVTDLRSGSPDGADTLIGVDALAFADGTFALAAILSGPTEGDDSLTGTAGADTIDGLGGNDTIQGLAGDDRLEGGAGNDSITTGTGHNLVFGGDGADRITTSIGNDTIDGGAGADTIATGIGANSVRGGEDDDSIIASIGNDTLHGDAGNDTINAEIGDNQVFGGDGADSLVAGIGADTLDGGEGADTLAGGNGNDVLMGGVGDDTADFSAFNRSSINHTITHIAGGFIVTGIRGASSAGADTLSGVEFLRFSDTIISVGGLPSPTQGGDSLTGTAGADIIDGLGGNDTIAGLAGDDTLIGGAGADSLSGGAGRNTLSYESDAAGVVVNLRADTASGGHAEGDVLVNDFKDVIGGAGNDWLIGDEGDHAFYGRGGADTLQGGDFNDYLVGGEGTDLAVFTGARSDYLLVESSGTHYVIDMRDGSPDGGDVVESIEFLSFAGDVMSLAAAFSTTLNGDDSLVGTPDPDLLEGVAGNDTLNGGGGNDTLAGGVGNDSLNGGAGADSMAGGDGNDIYWVDDIGDQLSEGALGGNDRVISTIDYTLPDEVEWLSLSGTAALKGTGNAGANRFNGNSGANTIDGGAGNDTIYGNAGDDSLIGGLGNDTLIGDTGADTLLGGLGNDVYSVDDLGDRVIEAINEGYDRVQGSISIALAEGSEIERLVLLGTLDLAGTGNGFANRIDGNAGANLLDGAAGADTLYGNDGADTLLGGEGHDRLDGGTGADSLVGGAGNDLYIVDHVGDVVVEGSGAGRDVVRASVSFTLAAGLQVEQVVLTGTANLAATGNALGNWLDGNGGANMLSGGDGNDTLFGNAGADTLAGGLGIDRLEGGAGADSYVYGEANEGGDVIVGFVGADDRIAVSSAGFFGGALEAGTDLAAAGHFFTNATAAATGSEAQFIYQTGENRLWFDADGSGDTARVLLATLSAPTGWTDAGLVLIA